MNKEAATHLTFLEELARHQLEIFSW